MNKEEIKAIESLKGFAYTIHGTLSVGEAKTILNLIKNLQKENEELEKKDKDTHKLQELLDISDAKNVKKDKIIDEMAEEFRTKTLMYSDMSKEEVKQYFERKVENGN